MEQTEMFLSDEQVIKLTGRKIKKLQCEHLKRLGIPFHQDAAGKLVVCRDLKDPADPAQ